MTFLPARQLSWRYGKGSRSLEDTLAVKSDRDTITSTENHHDNGQEGEGFDVPEQVEEIIGQLLNGLRDKDTVVRWTAAKGLIINTCTCTCIHECIVIIGLVVLLAASHLN